MTNVFLGYPPERIRKWIKEHYSTAPAAKAETVFYFGDGTSEEHLIEGTLDINWMMENGYYSSDSSEWEKGIVKAEIGTGVTSIGSAAFSYCWSLTSVTIPEGVTSIGRGAF